MVDSYKISLTSVFAVLVLLPIFFVSGTVLPLGVSKALILSLGAIVAFIAFLYETLKQGRIVLPRIYLLWGALAIPLVYLASSFTSSMPAISLYGYSFETGTFGSILFFSALFGITAVAVKSVGEIMKGYTAILLSMSLVVLFALVKIFSGGDAFVFGAFSGVMGNPIGAWTDYATMFALVSIISLFGLEMLSLKRGQRVFLYALLVLSVFLLAVINFSIAWKLLFMASLVAIVYFMTVEKRFPASVEMGAPVAKKSKFLAPIFVLVVSLLFMLNPVISSNGSIGNTISNYFGVSNADVRPSISSTMSVAKEVLKKDLILGSGPNTFDQDWLLYKPQEINSTSFWNTPFPYGVGFLPTQVATTGLLGTLVWLAFFVLYVLLGAKAIKKGSENKNERFVVITSFVSSLFLWISVFLYMPSLVVLTMAFILSGIFVASSVITGVVGQYEISFSKYVSLNFITVLLMIVLGIGAAAMGFVSLQKVISLSHFQKALVLSNTSGVSKDDVVTELGKASSLSEQDIHFGALSQIEFARAQEALANTTNTPEQNRQAFEQAMSKSIAGAQAATNLNPGNYRNWIALGSIYEALVPAPLSVDGAYESAKNAFEEARKRNPLGPEVPLLLAKLELDKGNISGARLHIKDSLEKKADFADAYFLLTQLEVSQNNINEAIVSAENAAFLRPDNAGLFFQLGLLKYSGKNYTGAAEALTQALNIVPDYANAKYYLGLSLDVLGRKAEAISLFEDLARSNPENEGVAKILSNLKDGKDAFYQTPVSKRPSAKKTPPISN
ncbi:MAG: Tfp pilus assembly protein PilF [Parcubacteria bacterium C7867-005]|nr:MAG: Tfp pilus assembly protein PilF [Parcubacteria bacterium C7867-005]